MSKTGGQRYSFRPSPGLDATLLGAGCESTSPNSRLRTSHAVSGQWPRLTFGLLRVGHILLMGSFVKVAETGHTSAPIPVLEVQGNILSYCLGSLRRLAGGDHCRWVIRPFPWMMWLCLWMMWLCCCCCCGPRRRKPGDHGSSGGDDDDGHTYDQFEVDPNLLIQGDVPLALDLPTLRNSTLSAQRRQRLNDPKAPTSSDQGVSIEKILVFRP